MSDTRSAGRFDGGLEQLERDEYLMGLALAEAHRAASAGEVPVGAVLTGPAGEVLAKSGNRPIALNDPSAHAEMLVIRRAARLLGNYRLGGCTLHVTLEPCVMCAGAILHARIGRLVYGASDLKGGAVASCYRIGSDGLLNHELRVTSGVMAVESSRLLKDFFRKRREGR